MGYKDLTHALMAELRICVGEEHLFSEGLDLWSGDASDLRGIPDIVVEPGSTEEVAAVVKAAARLHIPVITRGAGSGLAGGAVANEGGVLLSLSRMTRIIEIDESAMTVSVEAGLITGELQAAVEERGLFYPPDPASLAICSIGGNVACNSGGPRAVKYGVTRQYVLGMTIVLANGDILRLGGKTHKQASGYALHHLFVGSEGTLGIITEVTLRLIPKPAAVATLTALFPSLHHAASAVTAVLHSGILPCTIELMDQTTLKIIESYVHIGLPQMAGAMLVIEQDGLHLAQLRQELEIVGRRCEEEGGFGIEVATEEADRDRLWAGRRAVYFALKAYTPNRRSDDIVVPRSMIPAICDRIQEIAAETGRPIAVFGHAGDGNLHPSILYDAANPDHIAAVERAGDAVVRAAIEFGGMVSGEHGIGLLRLGYLEETVGQAAVMMMVSLKRTLDPHNILNPGKIFHVPSEVA